MNLHSPYWNGRNGRRNLHRSTFKHELLALKAGARAAYRQLYSGSWEFHPVTSEGEPAPEPGGPVRQTNRRTVIVGHYTCPIKLHCAIYNVIRVCIHLRCRC
jgi:hypothetical protein